MERQLREGLIAHATLLLFLATTLDGSQLSVTPALEESSASVGLLRHTSTRVHTDTQTHNLKLIKVNLKNRMTGLTQLIKTN